MKYYIVKHYIDFPPNDYGYKKAIKLVRYEKEFEPKIEIRDWLYNDDGDIIKIGYGIRFTREETIKLRTLLEKVLNHFGREGKMINYIPLDENIKKIGHYIDDEYGEFKIYKYPKPLEELSSEDKLLKKEVNFVYWDDVLPGTKIKLKGLKIDIRYWPLHLDLDLDENNKRRHRGITLDNNYEIQKTIEVFDNYINNSRWQRAVPVIYATSPEFSHEKLTYTRARNTTPLSYH